MYGVHHCSCCDVSVYIVSIIIILLFQSGDLSLLDNIFMSVFPVFNASFSACILLGIFFWNSWLLLGVLICVGMSISLYIFDVLKFDLYYVSGFWLFIFSEVIVFGSLIFCCLYFDLGFYPNLSSSLELPFLGCFILLGSSITVTAYHHLINWEFNWVPLSFTIVLGLFFVVMQLVEMEEILMNLYDTTFHASSFCTIGLHFSHVLLGVIALGTILVMSTSLVGFYRCTLIVWYWHFVDYIWLLVYTFVYVC